MDALIPLLLRLDDADARALGWIARRRNRALVSAMRALTRTGDALVVAAALAVASAIRPGRVAALVTLSTLGGLALFWLAKRVVRRARPSVHRLIPTPDCFSMPSGHATCAAAIAVSLSALVPLAAPLVCAW